jgi:hypothetical protein
MSILYSLAVTSKKQSKVSAKKNCSSSNLKTSRGAIPEVESIPSLKEELEEKPSVGDKF